MSAQLPAKIIAIILKNEGAPSATRRSALATPGAICQRRVMRRRYASGNKRNRCTSGTIKILDTQSLAKPRLRSGLAGQQPCTRAPPKAPPRRTPLCIDKYEELAGGGNALPTPLC